MKQFSFIMKDGTIIEPIFADDSEKALKLAMKQSGFFSRWYFLSKLADCFEHTENEVEEIPNQSLTLS